MSSYNLRKFDKFPKVIKSAEKVFINPTPHLVCITQNILLLTEFSSSCTNVRFITEWDKFWMAHVDTLGHVTEKKRVIG